MKRTVECFRCETRELADEINRYANLYDLQIVSLVVADTIGDIVIAYVIFEEEQK
jgi:hypothetical protein